MRISPGRRPSQPAPMPAQSAMPTTMITPPKTASVLPSSRMREDNNEERFTNGRLFICVCEPSRLDKKQTPLNVLRSDGSPIPRLLRDPWRDQDSERRRNQEGVSQAGASASPRRREGQEGGRREV